MDMRMMHPKMLAQFYSDALRQGSLNPDPSANMQGQPFMPSPAPSNEDASGLGNTVGGVAGALAERERQRRQLLEQMNQ